ncbi:MAG TPA: hypothetical protein VK348_09920 [Planctomycetota bacterium]|nr:hypothetical protein [Planctomycetota bacterium]
MPAAPHSVAENTPRFRYWRDPVFITAVLLYFVNRWLLKPLTGNSADFFHCYLNDVICIPFWLPPVLALHRLLRLRRHDAPPTFGEILLHLGIWSWLFEILGPGLHALFPYAVGDPWDIVAYAAGAGIAALLWRSGFHPGEDLVERRQAA